MRTRADLKRFRRRLVALARRLQGDSTGLADEALRGIGGDAGGSPSKVPLHLADLGTDTSDQHLSLTLLENDSRTLEEIVAALARLEDGTFGTCQECGAPIPVARLDALPYTRYCIACARELAG